MCDENKISIVAEDNNVYAYWTREQLKKAFEKKYKNSLVYAKAHSRGDGANEEFKFVEAYEESGFNYDENKRTIWQCNKKFKNDKKCTTPHLSEEQIKEVYLKALNQLITDKTSIIEDLKYICKMLLKTEELERKLKQAQEELCVATKIIQEYFNGKPITDSNTASELFSTYQKQYEQAKLKADRLFEELTRLLHFFGGIKQQPYT